MFSHQYQDSLLVKRRNDNHPQGPVIRKLVPSSHQRSELSNTILCISWRGSCCSFPFPVPRWWCPSVYLVWSVHTINIFRFARASSNVTSTVVITLTAKLLRQGYHKLRKTFSKFYRRHSGLVEKYNDTCVVWGNFCYKEFLNQNSMVT